MRILVTGGAGYVGAHVCAALRDANHDVAILDDFSTGVPARVHTDTTVYVGSLLDGHVVESSLRAHAADAVVHVAAKKAVEESVANPLHYYSENVLGMYNVLSAMISAGTSRILLSSSAAVYGVVEDSPVAESADTRPTSPYGSTKLICEQMTREVSAAHSISWSALRYFNVAGAAEPQLADVGENNLIPKIFRAVSSGMRPKVFGINYPTPDGSCIRDYVHVVDVANAHAAVIDSMRSANLASVYNVGTGVGTSVLEVLAAVQHVTGVNFQYDIVDRRIGDPAEVVADPTLIRKSLGWEPRYDIVGAVESAWRAWSHTRSCAG